MVNLNSEGVKPPRNVSKPLGRKMAVKPTNPRKVFRIVYLRDHYNMTWQKISEDMGMSRQGPYLLYARWHKWVKEVIKEQDYGTP